MRKLIIFVCLFASALSAQGKQSKCGVVHPTAHRVGTYTAGELGGRTLGDLYAGYIGVKQIPAQVVVDPARQLDSLWKVKIACNKKVGAVVKKLHAELLSSYKDGKSAKTLPEFVSIADRIVQTAKSDLDWLILDSLYHLSGQLGEVTKKLSESLSGRDFVAYGMTEIMPTDNGLLNMQVLEFLVRNYGPEFVYRIPAIHDKYASFGFFQFTSLALNGHTLEGASRASLALVRNPLPGSVENLQESQQFRAAYLFAVHNIARMVGKLNKIELSTLSAIGSGNHDDLVQFIAAAHNSPGNAYTAARRWLDNGMKADFYVSVKNESVRAYALKTKMNLDALNSWHESVLYVPPR